jgi:hypothetical protein
MSEDGGQDFLVLDFLDQTLKPLWQPTILHR